MLVAIEKKKSKTLGCDSLDNLQTFMGCLEFVNILTAGTGVCLLVARQSLYLQGTCGSGPEEKEDACAHGEHRNLKAPRREGVEVGGAGSVNSCSRLLELLSVRCFPAALVGCAPSHSSHSSPRLLLQGKSYRVSPG